MFIGFSLYTIRGLGGAYEQQTGGERENSGWEADVSSQAGHISDLREKKRDVSPEPKVEPPSMGQVIPTRQRQGISISPRTEADQSPSEDTSK